MKIMPPFSNCCQRIRKGGAALHPARAFSAFQRGKQVLAREAAHLRVGIAVLQKRFDQVREVRGARETLRLHLDSIEIRAEADDVLAAQLAKAVDVAHNVLHRGLFRLRKEMRIEVHADKAVFLNDRLGLRLIKIARRVAQLAATGMTGNRRETMCSTMSQKPASFRCDASA